mmetsp:Transcript_72827/g.146607  ORF Transcript_72827/g.146607 Transcript_72827/m.146607 type:complete len:202 (+) Transcript_72827:918-1523(+)
MPFSNPPAAPAASDEQPPCPPLPPPLLSASSSSSLHCPSSRTSSLDTSKDPCPCLALIPSTRYRCHPVVTPLLPVHTTFDAPCSSSHLVSSKPNPPNPPVTTCVPEVVKRGDSSFVVPAVAPAAAASVPAAVGLNPSIFTSTFPLCFPEDMNRNACSTSCASNTVRGKGFTCFLSSASSNSSLSTTESLGWVNMLAKSMAW